MKLIFLHGMPGVGKLTVGRELADLTGFALFHNHLTVDLVSSVFDFGTPPFVELREKIWLDVFRKASEEKLDGLIFTFAYDASVTSDFIEKVRSVCESNGGEVLFVELKCGEQELERRIVDPSRQASGKVSSLEQFRELNEAGAFVDPGIPERRIVLDSTNLSASEAAVRIISELGLSPPSLPAK